MTFDKISRRRVLQGTAAVTLGTALPLRAAMAADTTVGFIYVGSRDDYGYNQAHAAGAAALKKMPGIKVVEEEKVPETDAVEKTMEIDDQSRRRDAAVPDLVRLLQSAHAQGGGEVSEAAFEHCGGLWPDKDPKNAGSYFGYIDEAQYMSAASSPAICRRPASSASSPPSRSRRCCATSTRSPWAPSSPIRKSRPQVIFTGDWSMPVKEAEATNSLIDQGVDVLTCHVDGPKTMVENAARRGAMVVRLPRQSVGAGAEGLSHRRRVELGSALSAVRQDVHVRRSRSRISIAAA